MGERINFPKNYEAFLKKAIVHFQEGDIEEAVRCFQLAYAIRQEPIVNTMYVSALYQAGDYQTAKEIADEKKEVYEKEEGLHVLYTTILIKNRLFVEAERIIQKKLLNSDSAEGSIWESARLELDNAREKQKREKEERNQELAKNILAMGGKSFEYQSRLVKQMGELDESLYSFSAKSLLSNPFVNEIVKSTVIEELIEKKSEEEVELVWFKERRKIVPAQLTSLEENKTVQEVLARLKENFEDTNPSLYQMLLQEIQLYFLLLHPYVDEVVTDSNQWLALCFKRYDSGKEDNDEENEQMKKMAHWIDFLNKEIENMIP